MVPTEEGPLSSPSSLLVTGPQQPQAPRRQGKRFKFQWILSACIIGALTQLFGITPVLYHTSIQYLSQLSTTTRLEGELQLPPQLRNNTNSETSSMENTSTILPTTTIDNDDIHNQSLAILDLLDWEMESANGIQHDNATQQDSDNSCQPPNGTMHNCCLGCLSMGGDIHYSRRIFCSGKSLQDYHVVRDHAQQVLDASSHLLLLPQEQQQPVVACDICRIIEVARKHNLTIGIFGDSMTTQVFQGLICEMQRRNYNVTVERKVHGGDSCMVCIRSITHLYIRSPLWNDDDPSVYMKFMFQYRYPFANATEEHYVATTSDVLVINFGLHWGYTRRAMYQQAMDDFLKYLKYNGTFQLLAHRETSAQHFDADGGDYSLQTGNYSTMCVPMTWNGSTTAGWREQEVETSARNHGYNVITADHTMDPSSNQSSLTDDLYILPFFNFTATHYTMHPLTRNKNSFQDCSHYCGSPFVYQPIWRSLRLAMDRRFELESQPWS